MKKIIVKVTWIVWWVATVIILTEGLFGGISVIVELFGGPDTNLYPPLAYPTQVLCHLILSYQVWVADPCIADLIEEYEKE